MERLTCDYCGLPFRAPYRPAAEAKAYCCSGCAMASQLGIAGDKFPITPQLVFGLVFAFGVFNQLLLWGLAATLGREGRAGSAALFLLISVALGAVLYLAALLWLLRAKWLRASDGFVFALLAGPALAAVVLAWANRGSLGALIGFGANSLLGLWQARGFVRRWWAGRSKG